MSENSYGLEVMDLDSLHCFILRLDFSVFLMDFMYNYHPCSY